MVMIKAKRWADDFISLQVSLLSYRPLHTCVCCAYRLPSTHVTYSFLDSFFFPNGHDKAKRLADDVTSFQVSLHDRPLHTRVCCACLLPSCHVFTVSKSIYSLYLCVFICTLCFSGVEGYLLCLHLAWLLMLSFFYTCFGSLSYFVFMIQCFDVL